jgi:uncharacterized protein (TIGR00369 family)
VETQNFNDWLEMRPGDQPGEVVVDTRPEHQVAPGLIHFAVLTTLAEVSAATAVAGPVVPTTLSINLMRRAGPGRLVGRGKVIKRGRTLSVAEGEVLQEDKLVAKATVTFAMMG